MQSCTKPSLTLALSADSGRTMSSSIEYERMRGHIANALFVRYITPVHCPSSLFALRDITASRPLRIHRLHGDPTLQSTTLMPLCPDDPSVSACGYSHTMHRVPPSSPSPLQGNLNPSPSTPPIVIPFLHGMAGQSSSPDPPNTTAHPVSRLKLPLP